MPRTKKRQEPAPQAVSASGGVNGPAAEVFTLAEAAAYLRLPEQDVLRMIQEQGLPARQVGTEWRFLKAAIQQWLGAGSSSLQ
jgi:excisionase family DNA binding protein